MSWMLAATGLAMAAGAVWLLSVRLGLELRLAPNAASLQFRTGSWRLAQARLIWQGAAGRIRVRARGGRWNSYGLRPLGLPSDWWHGPAELARTWRLTRRHREVQRQRTVQWAWKLLLRRLRWGRIELAIHHGCGRPDRTGYLCAGYWALAGLWRALSPLVSIAYRPEFERRIFRASARGQVSLPLYCVPVLLYLVMTLRWAGSRRDAPSGSHLGAEGGLDATG